MYLDWRFNDTIKLNWKFKEYWMIVFTMLFNIRIELNIDWKLR